MFFLVEEKSLYGLERGWARYFKLREYYEARYDTNRKLKADPFEDCQVM